MKKKYRIKTMVDQSGIMPVYMVQVRTWWSMWVNVKQFYDPWEPEFALSEANELIEKLNEN